MDKDLKANQHEETPAKKMNVAGVDENASGAVCQNFDLEAFSYKMRKLNTKPKMY